jgi:tRNA(fMet)-specific endonuclease VapC
MEYLLDTNICIYFFKGQFQLVDRFRKVGFENCAISEITLAELIYGAEKSQHIERNLQVIRDFAEKITILPIIDGLFIYGREKARLKASGTLISDLDLLIGASAIANNMVLVTRNVREFERLKELRMENWID